MKSAKIETQEKNCLAYWVERTKALINALTIVGESGADGREAAAAAAEGVQLLNDEIANDGERCERPERLVRRRMVLVMVVVLLVVAAAADRVEHLLRTRTLVGDAHLFD